MAEYRIFSRNADLSKNAEITNFSSLTMNSKYNHAGKWKMSGSGRSPFTYQQGIIVERDGVNIFSGIVTKIEKEMSADEYINRSWQVTGIDDLARLAFRKVHPDPVNLTINTSMYDTRTGTAEAVILGYVDANCGSGAHADRRFPNFQTALSSGRGLVVTDNARFDPLLDFIYNLAQRGRIGYKVAYDAGLGKLVFSIFEPVDRSADVMFSTDFGNLQSFKHILEAPKANFVWTLGQGEGIARAMGSASDAVSIANWGRIEDVKDQRNEPDSAQLNTWAATEIDQKKEKEGYSFKSIQLGSIGFTYGVDYQIGDLVSVADDGIVLEDTVTEVEIKLSDNGEETITPTIGKVKDIPLKNTFDKIDDLSERVATLETSQ